jgi:hypothetical protein
VKDFLFVDALSGTPLGDEGKDSVRPVKRRSRRVGQIILVALIALIIMLAAWAGNIQ